MYSFISRKEIWGTKYLMLEIEFKIFLSIDDLLLLSIHWIGVSIHLPPISLNNLQNFIVNKLKAFHDYCFYIHFILINHLFVVFENPSNCLEHQFILLLNAFNEGKKSKGHNFYFPCLKFAVTSTLSSIYRINVKRDAFFPSFEHFPCSNYSNKKNFFHLS